MAANIYSFRLPAYSEIPDVGLYLEQVVKYINTCLSPLGCMEITPSMVSNYVKQGYIERPVKKQYSAKQIAYLIVIAIIKTVLSMENIVTLFELQRKEYAHEIAYDYFCKEFEAVLRSIFSENAENANPVKGLSEEKKMLHSVIIGAAHIVYLNDCFDRRKQAAIAQQ